MTPGIVICCGLAFAVALWPEQVSYIVERSILEMRIMHLNFVLKRAQRKLYKQLCKDAKTLGIPQPPPFEFVRLQDRGRL